MFSNGKKNLKEANHIASVDININIIKSRPSGQPWDGHDVTTDGVEEACTYATSNFPHSGAMTGRNSLCGWITAETVLGLCNTYRQIPKASLFVLFNLFVRYIGEVDSIGSINLSTDDFDLFLDRKIHVIKEFKVLRM
jgi:hypothetical protein